jgi:hypothetical protein
VPEDHDATPPSEPEPKQPSAFARLRAWAARRRDKAEGNWRFLDAELKRGRLLTKVVLLHLRYTFGYLAFGFLVSAPLQLGYRHEWGESMLKSLALGLLCALPFGLLWPFTKIDWGRMRVPEFKNLELRLTRLATLCAALWLLVASVVHFAAGDPGEGKATTWWVWICDPRVAWLTLGLMFFAWLRVKFHTLLFREFYTLKPEDDLVLRVPPSQLKLDLGKQRASPDAAKPRSEQTAGDADL